jgi:hypothetical protein
VDGGGAKTPKKSQLTSIQECTNNGRCLPKTKFSWNNEEVSFGVNGKQWQSDLGGSDDWKNRPISNSIRITTVTNSHHHLNCFAIVYLSQNHYLYLEIHKNLVDRYLDFCQTLDRVKYLTTIQRLTTSQGFLSILIQAMALIMASNVCQTLDRVVHLR